MCLNVDNLSGALRTEDTNKLTWSRSSCLSAAFL